AALECSVDGRTWVPLIGELTKQYVIRWQGEPVKARYVRLKRLDSDRKNYASIRTFDVNPVRIDNLGFKLEMEQPQQAVYAFDQNPGTSCRVTQNLSFEVPQGVKGYTLLMGKLPVPLKFKQFDKKGSLVSETSVSSPFFKVELTNDEVSKVSIEGNAEIFEIIAEL
ncbi:MAG: beta-N-acetylglucosaminidase, partial [Bacteroides sp.]|nr:beta-N-acetylglucosaminidase [Bacteroides sp.]